MKMIEKSSKQNLAPLFGWKKKRRVGLEYTFMTTKQTIIERITTVKKTIQPVRVFFSLAASSLSSSETHFPSDFHPSTKEASSPDAFVPQAWL
jgi:hypothetical protein